MSNRYPGRKVVRAWVTAHGSYGGTRLEALEAFDLEDGGSLSGALSKDHQEGLLVGLAETRSGFRVYVSPKHVHGRETVAQRGNKPCPHCGFRAYDPDADTKEWGKP